MRHQLIFTPPPYPQDSYQASGVSSMKGGAVWHDLTDGPSGWDDMSDALIGHCEFEKPTRASLRVMHSTDGGLTARDVTDDVIAAVKWPEGI